MTVSSTLLVLLAMSAAAFFVGRRRSLALADASGGIRSLHSLPAHYGMWTAILCGLPALILKFIDPSILEDTGYDTVEELSAAPHFPAIVEGALRTFKERFPHARVVIVDREGRVVGDSG